MKIPPARPRNRALTLPEVIVIVAVVGLLAGFLMPPIFKHKSTALRVNCVNQLKSVAFAFRIWAGDHGGQYPMAFYTNAMGGPAFADSSNAFRYFQILSNELSAPKILLCPLDRERQFATNFTSDFNNQRVSYFVALQARESRPDMFLAGDRNLTNGMAMVGGSLRVDTHQVGGWTDKIHRGNGNIAVTEGGVHQLSNPGLNREVRLAGVTNWLLFP